MILTVHGSDLWYWLFMVVIIKNKNASNIINDYRRDRQAGRRAKSCMWLSCIQSYLAPYLQHTEGVHQSIIIIINHYFPPPEKCKNCLIQYTLSWAPLEIQKEKIQKDNMYSFLPHGITLVKWVEGGTTVFFMTSLSKRFNSTSCTYLRWKLTTTLLVPAELSFDW